MAMSGTVSRGWADRLESADRIFSVGFEVVDVAILTTCRDKGVRMRRGRIERGAWKELESGRGHGGKKKGKSDNGRGVFVEVIANDTERALQCLRWS